MTKEIKFKLKEIFQELSAINSTFTQNGISSHHLEFIIDDNGDAVLSGNPQGLVYMAKSFIELSLKDVDGSHYHFDEQSMLDKCEKNLIVMLEKNR